MDILALSKEVENSIHSNSHPFFNLSSFKNEFGLDTEFYCKWMDYNFALTNFEPTDDWILSTILVKEEITKQVVLDLLGEYDWRSRTCGAFLSAVTDEQSAIDIIGVHMLKEDLCCSHSTYCQVLASFNTSKSIEYLELYLKYYLRKPSNYQGEEDTIKALLYLDEVNSSQLFQNYEASWLDFLSRNKKRSVNLDMEHFRRSVAIIEKIKNAT